MSRPCCTPYYPAGFRPYHSNYCKVAPRTKMSDEDFAGIRNRRKMQADQIKKAASTGNAKFPTYVQVWKRHHYSCVCETCQYVEAHLDDADDARGATL